MKNLTTINTIPFQNFSHRVVDDALYDSQKDSLLAIQELLKDANLLPNRVETIITDRTLEIKGDNFVKIHISIDKDKGSWYYKPKRVGIRIQSWGTGSGVKTYYFTKATYSINHEINKSGSVDIQINENGLLKSFSKAWIAAHDEHEYVARETAKRNVNATNYKLLKEHLTEILDRVEHETGHTFKEYDFSYKASSFIPYNHDRTGSGFIYNKELSGDLLEKILVTIAEHHKANNQQ